MAMHGSCLCKAVTFTAEDAQLEYAACHCGMCRRWSGGSAFFSAASRGVVFTGEDHITRYDSSPWAQRGFCSRCGSTLFYFLKPTKTFMMSVGAFDDSTEFRLVREIFIDRKPDGYAFAGDHERWTEAETFERLTPK
jgi:hypothetical protein